MSTKRRIYATTKDSKYLDILATGLLKTKKQIKRVILAPR